MIYDHTEGDFIMPMGKDMGIGMNGDLHLRLGDNLAMNTNSGNLCLTSSWSVEDEDEDEDSSNNYLNNNYNKDDSNDDFFGIGKLFGGIFSK